MFIEIYWAVLEVKRYDSNNKLSEDLQGDEFDSKFWNTLKFESDTGHLVFV